MISRIQAQWKIKFTWVSHKNLAISKLEPKNFYVFYSIFFPRLPQFFALFYFFALFSLYYVFRSLQFKPKIVHTMHRRFLFFSSRRDKIIRSREKSERFVEGDSKIWTLSSKKIFLVKLLIHCVIVSTRYFVTTFIIAILGTFSFCLLFYFIFFTLSSEFYYLTFLWIMTLGIFGNHLSIICRKVHDTYC